MSKVIQDCLGFVLLPAVTGPENSRHFLNQSDVKLTPSSPRFPVFRKLAPLSQPIRCKTKTKQPAFSRASGSMGVFTLSFHWLLKACSFLLIGCCDYFGFDFNDTQSKSVLAMITLTQAARHGALKTYAFLGQAQSTE